MQIASWVALSPLLLRYFPLLKREESEEKAKKKRKTNGKRTENERKTIEKLSKNDTEKLAENIENFAENIDGTFQNHADSQDAIKKAILILLTQRPLSSDTQNPN